MLILRKSIKSLIMNQLVSKYYKHLLVLIGFVLFSLIYFNPVLRGEQIFQSDIVQYTGMAKQQIDFRAETGTETYWTNSAFGGMPTYQLGAKYPHNYIKALDLLIRFLPRPADYLFLYLTGFYILLLTFRQKYHTAVLGALAFGLSTYLIIIIGVGHNAKAHAIAYMPFVLSGIVLTFQNRYLLGFVVTTIFSALEIVANHFQMTYYLLFVILFLIVSLLINAFKNKQLSSIVRPCMVLASAAVLSITMNATSILATREYAKESTRSQSELTIQPDGSEKHPTSGLEKDYITEYSYGILESINLFIPRFMGGGNSEDVGKDSNIYQAYRDLGASPIQALNASKSAPMYWGDQPIVEAPAYIGATVLFLFIFSLFFYKGIQKKWLLSVMVLALLLSFGKNLMWLTNFFIENVPLYNKFRAVSSIQVILELCVPILAMLGLHQLFDKEFSKGHALKALKMSTILLAGLCSIVLIFKSSLFDFASIRDGQYQNYYGENFVKALRMDRSTLLTSDTFRSLSFVLLMAFGIWAYIRGKVSKNILVAVIAVLFVLDLGGVNRRYVNEDNFTSALKVKKPYSATEIDKEIFKDDSVFRVYDTTDSSTKASYFHNSIGGYHAAKLRRFNELTEFHINSGNPEVFNMLNTKYIIYTNDGGELQYLNNEQANGNAWFVETLNAVADADAEILALNDINTKKTAIINETILQSASFQIDSLASIRLESYAPNKLIYKSRNTFNGFAVFSENYYHNGWQATIDGQDAVIYNVNYVLRGLEIPKGEHTIIFEFKPKVVQTGSRIAFSSSIIFIFIVMGISYFIFFKKQS